VASAAETLGLDAGLLRSLDRLTLPTRRSLIGQGAGQRRSPRPGTSVEFADFRTYVPGDDFRRIDWNAYARLDRLLLKLYLGEEDLAIHLWLDLSTSMNWGQPPKAGFARALAGALAYIGLRSYDRVGMVGFADHVLATLRPQRGRAATGRLWDFLAKLPSGGPTDFAALRAPSRGLARGVSVILSDFLTESDPAPALTALRQARQELVLLQVLAPQELAPDLQGDLSLRDSETNAAVEVTVTPALRSAYAAALEEHTLRLLALARAHGALFQQVSSGQDLGRLLLDTFRRGGVLR
jgi:uncharacterized protein (DUF58 family)